MNAKVERIENNVVKMEITVEAEKFNEAVKKSYKKNVKKYNIPGFRRGKAPMGIVKRYYGEGVFYEDAINFCCDDTYPEVIKENNIKPVDYPKIDIVEIGEGKDFVYTAEVVVRPEVELGQYKDVEVKKTEYKVTDEEIEQNLKGLQERNARVEKKEEGSVENGNIAVIDFKGFIDGVAFEGGEGKDYPLEIGSGSFIDNFEEQLIGLNVGDTKNVSVKFPENYGKEELNGKPAVFEVTVKEIKIKEKPAIDDEFAKEVSEFDTLEEMKNDLKSKLEKNYKEREEREYEEAVLDTVCGNAKVDIPEVMINNEIDVLIKELEFRLKMQGLDLKAYYQYTNNTEESVREYMKESAERRVKSDLVIEKIAEAEKIEVTEEEILAKATETAKQYGEANKDKMIDTIMKSQKDYLKIQVSNEKVIKMLVENSKAI